MNRFKKFMAGVTSAAMMLAGTAAFAMVPPDVAGTNIEEEAELLGALGIMVGDKESGNFRPDANIRRSEFAKIAVETLGLGSVAESNKAPTKFPDVVSDHWANGYINVAANQGLVIGDQYNNFRPDDNVSYAEAMTVLVRMLGHEPAAESKGQWPTGHLVVGSQIGVSKNVSSQATNAPISRATAAKMDFNSLTIKLMEQTGYGENIRYEVVDKTILKDKLDVDKEYGQIVANADTRLDNSNGLKDGKVQVGDKIYNTGKTNAKNLLGYNTVLYSRENDGGENELLVARADSNKTSSLEISATNIDKTVTARAGGKIMLKYWEDKENDRTPKTAYIDADAKLIYNGKSVPMETALLQPSFGKLTLLDNNRDDEYDVVFSTEYTNYVVENTSPSSFTVTDKYGKPALKLDPEDKNISFSMEDKNGQKVAFEDLKEWTILSVTESKDKSLLKIGVSNESVTGKVTETSEEKVKINGKEYEIADNYTSAISINDEGTFYLDIEGKIAAVDTTATRSGNYAYLIDGAKSSNIGGTVELKLFTKTGETVVLKTADRVQLNKEASKDAETVLNQLKDGGSVKAQLITYEVNSAGEVVKINTASDKTSDGSYSKEFVKNYAAEDVVYKSASSKLGRFNVNADTIVFDLPAGETDPENFAIRNKDMFINDSKYNVEIYDMGEDLTASVVIVTNSSGKTSAEAPIAVVNKIAYVQNDRGEDVEKIYVAYKGEEVSFLGDKAGIFVKDGNKTLEAGDIIQFKTNVRGEIDTLSVLFDVSKRDTEFLKSDDDGLTTVHGKVVKKFANSVNVSVNDGSIENYGLSGVTVYKYDSTRNNNKVSIASGADIIRYDDADPQTIFIRMYKDEVKEMVIIK